MVSETLSQIRFIAIETYLWCTNFHTYEWIRNWTWIPIVGIQLYIVPTDSGTYIKVTQTKPITIQEYNMRSPRVLYQIQHMLQGSHWKKVLINRLDDEREQGKSEGFVEKQQGVSTMLLQALCIIS